MMPSILQACLALVMAMGTLAQNYVDDLSFGHKQGISTNSFAIPGWSMLGEGYVPQLLSDKVILTPPYGGNKKGALWTENKNTLQDWQVDFDFRVGATERGAGNLQLWYANNGVQEVSTSSIYTVGKFDGLVLVIDTLSGVQKIRGFLNDGKTEYRSHGNVDGLAFGHCDYNYRNRPTSRLTLKSTSSGLSVTIDDKPCFSSTKITLPTNYNFGLTASSSDPPDSFEVFKFAASPTTPSTQPLTQQQPRQHQPNQASPGQMDTPPSSSSSGTEYRDLNTRIDLLAKSISNLFSLIESQKTTSSEQLNAIVSRLPNSQLVSTLDSKISNLDKLVRDLEREFKSSDHNTQFRKLSEQIQKTHEGVTEHMPLRIREYMIAHTPRIGFILYSFMGFQTCCIGAWGWYKWRKSTMPKKYL